MKYIELLDKVMRIQRRVNAKKLESKVLCGYLDSRDEFYIYIKCNNKSNHGLRITDSIEQIVNACVELEKDSFIEIDKLCINSLNDDVYILDGSSYVKCKIQYISKDGICINDKLYSKNEVFIKE